MVRYSPGKAFVCFSPQKHGAICSSGIIQGRYTDRCSVDTAGDRSRPVQGGHHITSSWKKQRWLKHNSGSWCCCVFFWVGGKQTHPRCSVDWQTKPSPPSIGEQIPPSVACPSISLAFTPTRPLAASAVSPCVSSSAPPPPVSSQYDCFSFRSIGS